LAAKDIALRHSYILRESERTYNASSKQRDSAHFHRN
jgi:hypothetical protein